MMESIVKDSGEMGLRREMKRSYSLDFLKILATIGIVFHHFQ